MPVRHPHGDHTRGEPRRHDDAYRDAAMNKHMTKHEQSAAFSRRALLKAGGALVVSLGAPVAFDVAQAAGDAMSAATKPPLTPDQLSSYLTVNSEGSIST